jgi:single-strand DNA-binding protein
MHRRRENREEYATMAGSVNKVILVGNLGKDPESRTMTSGSKVVSFSLATSESWNDKASGERKEKTQWHRVAIFNEKIGEIAERYLKKGMKVYIEGSIESRKYTDKDGQEREITEVVLPRFRGELTMLDTKGGGGGDSYGNEGGSFRSAGASRPAPARAPAGAGAGGPSWEPAGGDLDDEIPF